MRTPCCHTSHAFILKFLSFLQEFIGVALIVYSAYMLNQWRHHRNDFFPLAPSHYESGIQLPADVVNPMNLESRVVSFDDNVLRMDFNSLPAPWFIYAFMGIGIVVCCITCIGHIAAEVINGCRLCFYAILTTIFVVLEVGLVTFIACNHQRKKDLPFDPTGELDSLMTFIEDNVDIFEWVGIAVFTIQALSLLVAIILRSLVSSPRVDDDIEADYNLISSTRKPLAIPHASQVSGSTRGDSDIWSSRMREKYGLGIGDAKHNIVNQKPSTDVKQ